MDWDAQKAIWDDIFTREYLDVRILTDLITSILTRVNYRLSLQMHVFS